MNIWSGSRHNLIPNRDLARETLVVTPNVIREMTAEESVDCTTYAAFKTEEGCQRL